MAHGCRMRPSPAHPFAPKAAPETEDHGALPRPTVMLMTTAARAAEDLWRYAAAAGIVAAGAVLAEVAYRLLQTTRLSMIFLGSVLVVAVRLGMGPALFAAVMAFCIYNFYLAEPRFTLVLADAEDVFTLAVFLAVGLLTGGLAGRLRDQSERATARARSLSTLFEASKILSVTEKQAALFRRLEDLLGQAAGGRAWVVGAGEAAPEAEIRAAEDEDANALLRLIAAARDVPAETHMLAHGPWRARVLVDEGRCLGVAAWRAPQQEGRALAETEAVLTALVDVAAGAVARARLSMEKSEAEAIARTERLRTALLSSISHDFRSPLAAILASASSLLEYDAEFAPETRRDLAQNVIEETERLNRFVANLLNMTRLESGVLEIDVQAVAAAEVARSAAARLGPRKGARRIAIAAAGDELQVHADPLLIEQALSNVLENAAAFSPDASTIDIGFDADAAEVRIEVSDLGPGVPDPDLGRIFDKFYRVAEDRRSAKGTGLGLSITKGMVEAMGGRVWARRRPDGQPGLSVVIAMPRSPA